MEALPDEIVCILYKHINKEILKPEEQELLDNWVTGSPGNQQVYKEVANDLLFEKEIREQLAIDRNLLWNKIKILLSVDAD